MRKTVYLVLVIGLVGLLAQSTFAVQTTAERTVSQGAKPAIESVITTTDKVDILAVDQAKRTVKIKASDGEVNTYQVGKDVRNLAQVKEGDVFKAKEVEKLSISVQKSKKTPSVTQSFSWGRAPKGAKPGFVAVEKARITGRVQLVRYDQRKVTITGPKGRSKSFDVARDVKSLNKLKAGDLVVADYTNTIAMYVETPKK